MKTYQQTPNTVTETLNTGKTETPNQTLIDYEQYTVNTKTQTLPQEWKINVEIMKRIMLVKKTTLSSLGNQDWRTVKSETKMNILLTNIPTSNIAETTKNM